MKKFLLVLAVITACFVCFADVSISANDLEPESVKTQKVFEEAFTFMGTESKPIEIQSMDERTAEDEEIFNNRIKFSGTGKVNLLSIKFTAKKGQIVTVYLNSSSKTDERALAFMKSDSTVVGKIIAPPATSDMTAGMGTFEIPEDGDYYVGSAKSGIYIYAIVITDPVADTVSATDTNVAK